MVERYIFLMAAIQQTPAERPMMLIEVSDYEAAMIKKLREHQFGQFTIYKNQGQPTRIVIGGSEILDPLSAKDMEATPNGTNQTA